MNIDKVVEIIVTKGTERLKEIFDLVNERITPENIPTYHPNAEAPDYYYVKDDGYKFDWGECPYYCANVEKELTEYFGTPTELCFDGYNNWHFTINRGIDGYINLWKLAEEIEAASDEINLYNLIERLPRWVNHIGSTDVGINEEPFKEAAIKAYYAKEK